jgi:hypothetical protein
MSRHPLVLAAVWFLFGLTSARAQSNSSTATPPAQTNSQDSAAQTPAKKVWTNEDMADLHDSSTTPAVTNPNAKGAKTNNKPAVNPSSKGAKWYQNQIAKLQAQFPEIDKKIADLQTALNGGQVNEVRHYGGNRIDDWHDELARLQQKRADIESKISALQDEARHNGVPVNKVP